MPKNSPKLFPFFYDGVAVIAGAILPLAFAPINITFIAFVSALALLFCLRQSSVKRAFIRGGLFGLAYFTVGVSWVYVSIHVYGNTPIILALILTLGFTALSGSVLAVMAALYVKFFSPSTYMGFILGFPCCWVLQEIFRTWFLTGFPWLLLGNSQVTSWLSGYAPLISVYGVSFIIVMLAALLLSLLYFRKQIFISLLLIILLSTCAFILKHQTWSQALSPAINVSLIQGNVPQSVKWDPDNLKNTLNKYRSLTDKHWQSDLIVWPEGAIPDLYNNQQPYFSELAKTAKKHKSSIIAGIAYNDTATGNYYNSAIEIGADEGIYHKQHLVPFGEYVPLENILRGVISFFDLPMSNFSPGSNKQTLLTAKGIKIAPFLCYEIAYLNLVLHAQPQAQLLLNISDDSWFGNSWASAQQLQISQMRSLETARQQIIVGNNGITAIIDAKGDIVKRLPKNKTGVLEGSVQGMKGTTPLVHIGWEIEFLLLLLLTFFCYFSIRRQK